MELRVIDFDILTRSFIPYVDGRKDIESEKTKMIEGIQPARKEMESIISRSQSGLIIDESSRKKDVDRFKDLQDHLMKADGEFKSKLKQMQEDLNTNVYDQLSDIVSEWARENNIDVVMGKMEIIFNTKNVEVTDDILEKIKQKGLFI